MTGGGILQFAQSVVAGSGGSKFSKNDVKKVYFASRFQLPRVAVELMTIVLL